MFDLGIWLFVFCLFIFGEYDDADVGASGDMTGLVMIDSHTEWMILMDWPLG